MEEVVDRPALWEDVAFKCVPMQEGEEEQVQLSKPMHVDLLSVRLRSHRDKRAGRRGEVTHGAGGDDVHVVECPRLRGRDLGCHRVSESAEHTRSAWRNSGVTMAGSARAKEVATR